MMERGEPRLVAGGRGELFLQDHLSKAFVRAEQIDIVAAFAQPAGVALLRGWLLSACGRGARARVLVSDYLGITDPRALRGLLDVAAATAGTAGGLEVRVIERAGWSALGSNFHAKGWIFVGEGGFGRAWVGSSNISYAALAGGVEWNLRLDRGDDPAGFAALGEAFERLWERGRALDESWIAAYEAARRPQAAEPGEEADAPPAPTVVQGEALEALARVRSQGQGRALVVMATGLGKTWLAALDVLASGVRRVLVVAHRAELLEQASRVMRAALPAASQGWVAGGHAPGGEGAQVVLAQVAALRGERLEALAGERFEYVIIDEAHHAPSASYQRVLARLDAGFVLGLTATPERLDVASVEGVFHGCVAYRAGLERGLRDGLLCPVAYWGLRDVVELGAVRFGGGRFDGAALEEALLAAHEARMARVWEAWQAHPGRRTLVFCQSVRHAQAVCGWLRGRGVRVSALWAGAGSADRQEALAALEAGELDALCAVDLLNEGVDIPSLDRVIMLRPTESPVIFLQQLGRGLRVSAAKSRLIVLDMVGNHHVFVDRMYSLFGAFGGDVSTLGAELVSRQRAWSGPGWEVTLELGAVDVLGELLAGRVGTRREQAWRAFEEAWARRGERPRAALMYALGGLGGQGRADVRGSGQTWFDALREAQPDALEEAYSAALEDEGARGWLQAVERGGYNKSFKLVVLRALLDADALWSGMEVSALCAACFGLMRGDAALWAELPDAVRALPARLAPQEAAVWERYWMRWPIAVWTGQEVRQRAGRRKTRGWFGVDEAGLFAPRFEVAAAHRAAVAAMTDELVEQLLARQRAARSIGIFAVGDAQYEHD